MSEPVLRRTQSGVCAALMHTPAFRFHSPLAKAISLCGVLSVLTFSAAPVLAADTAAATVYSIESAKAVESLLLDVAHAGACTHDTAPSFRCRIATWSRGDEPQYTRKMFVACTNIAAVNPTQEVLS